MSLILRFFLRLIKTRYSSKLHPFDTAILPMHVWPNDLDLLFHMNNGRFLSLMDLGRIDPLVRTGFWDEARKRKWYLVVGTTPIDYKRPLTVFQAYEL
jgi:acyl-CoA thioesterase FadM